MNFDFTKWQACGNDFVLVNTFDNIDAEKIAEIIKQSPKICDRHFGVGADGVIFILPSTIADFRMQIINSDGSEAEMCGMVFVVLLNVYMKQGLRLKQNLQ